MMVSETQVFTNNNNINYIPLGRQQQSVYLFAFVFVFCPFYRPFDFICLDVKHFRCATFKIKVREFSHAVLLPLPVAHIISRVDSFPVAAVLRPPLLTLALAGYCRGNTQGNQEAPSKAPRREGSELI